MAKKSTVKTKSIEETLWDSANKLRGTVESSEYKHVVLGLIFLKFASDKFEERRAKLIAEGKEKFIEMKEFYNMQNIFYLPEEARWSYIIEHSKQADIALKIDTALHTIEKNNPALKGALPDNYFSRLNMDVSKLAALLDTINNINTLQDKQQDIVGRVYEYFLSKFALAEGKGKVAVASRLLLDTLREFADQPLTITIDTASFSVVITSAQGKFSFICTVFYFFCNCH